MPRSDEILDDAGALLERRRIERAVARRPGATQRTVSRKLRNIFWACAAIVIAMFVWGLIVPIGTTGVMIAGLLMLAATLVNVFLVRERVPDAAALPKTALAQLPRKTESWLASQRALLPAPARGLADAIGVKLEALAPQLQTLDEREPAAAEIRRLIADELPELIKGYGRVPAALRREGVDGMAPDKQLVDGLNVVDSELARMSEQLARGDLEKLATQGKYLELKYQGEGLT